jgi:hypothetical protein
MGCSGRIATLSKTFRTVVAAGSVVLILMLALQASWHHEPRDPNCHICKACKIAVASFTTPIVVQPPTVRETLAVSPVVVVLARVEWVPSSPRSPPAL